MPTPKKPAKRPGVNATLWGIADTELLAIVDDLSNENGWTSTVDVRVQLGEDIEEVSHSGVGGRLSWMARYGWLERNYATNRNQPKEWRLTAIGQTILDGGDFTNSFQKTLDSLNPAQRVQVTRQISKANSPDEIRTALRREWNRNLTQQRRS